MKRNISVEEGRDEEMKSSKKAKKISVENEEIQLDELAEAVA